MTDATLPASPVLTALQIAWLQETGLDKSVLLRFKAPPVVKAGPVRQHVAAPLAQPASGGKPAPEALVVPRRTPRTLAHGLVGTGALLEGQRIARGAYAQPRDEIPRDEIPLDWTELQASVESCRACDLSVGRSHAVFGVGAAQAVQWMVVGEAPGDLDDRAGLPFQGATGELLRAMLGSVGVLSDAQVFFTNLVKCRPLGNRPPKPQEIAACLPYLQRQFAVLRPQRILVLGRLAAQALLGTDADLESLRGHVHPYRTDAGLQIPLVVTYHPVSLLSRPQHKAGAWHDLNLALAAR